MNESKGGTISNTLTCSVDNAKQRAAYKNNELKRNHRTQIIQAKTANQFIRFVDDNEWWQETIFYGGQEWHCFAMWCDDGLERLVLLWTQQLSICYNYLDSSVLISLVISTK